MLHQPQGGRKISGKYSKSWTSYKRLITSVRSTSESSVKMIVWCGDICYSYSLWKYLHNFVLVWGQVVITCTSARGSWLFFTWHTGCSLVSKLLCARCVSHIRYLADITLINNSWWQQVFHSPNTGTMRCSFLVNWSLCCLTSVEACGVAWAKQSSLHKQCTSFISCTLAPALDHDMFSRRRKNKLKGERETKKERKRHTHTKLHLSLFSQ